MNPYLMAGGLIHAIESGLSDRIEPGKATGADRYVQDGESSEISKTLEAALLALKSDSVIRKRLREEMHRLYQEHKQGQWARFMAQVTSWDFDPYMAHTP